MADIFKTPNPHIAITDGFIADAWLCTAMSFLYSAFGKLDQRSTVDAPRARTLADTNSNIQKSQTHLANRKTRALASTGKTK